MTTDHASADHSSHESLLSQGWFGLVCQSLDGVEVIPIVLVEDDGLMPLEEFARELVMASSNVTQAILSERMDPYDKTRDMRLECATERFADLDKVIEGLAPTALRVLIDELEILSDRVGREWLERIGSGSALSMAWYLDNTYTEGTTRLPYAISQHVTDAWAWLATPEQHERPKDLATCGCLKSSDGATDWLIVAHALVAGLSSVASVALNTGVQERLMCLQIERDPKVQTVTLHQAESPSKALATEVDPLAATNWASHRGHNEDPNLSDEPPF